MAFKLFSDVRETSTTGGTGNQVLGGAFDASYFQFSDRYSNSDTLFYCMKQGTSREIGLGTWNSGADSISRTQVYKSTNSNNLVNFSAGQTIDIFVCEIAADDLDDAGKALLASVQKVVSWADDQTLADADKTQVQDNIGAVGYHTDVTLSDGEKSQAQENIAAVGYHADQTLTDAQQAQVLENLGVIQGQCILVKNGSYLELQRFKGRYLFIAGHLEIVPATPITLSAPGTSGTVYWIYAYMNSGTMTLEASTTGPATGPTYGHKIKTGDATRTLVGMAATASSAWVDSATQRYVRTWFNDPGIRGQNSFTTSRSTTSLSSTEINSEVRIEFLAWESEMVNVHGFGAFGNGSGGPSTGSAVGYDGTADSGSWVFYADATGNVGPHGPRSAKNDLSEGYHYATIMGFVNLASTGNWTAIGGINAGITLATRGSRA